MGCLWHKLQLIIHKFIKMRFYFFCKILTISFLFFQNNLNAQIINIEDKRIKTKDSISWYGDFSLNASVVQLNKSILTFRSTAQIEYKKNKHLLLSLSDYALLKGGKESFENAAFQHLRYNYKLNKTLSWELYTQIQNNKIQHIELRALVGTGIRWRIYKSSNGKSRLYIGTALMQEYNRFKDDEIAYFSRISSYLSTVYEPNKQVKFSSNTYYQPNVRHFTDARLSSQNMLTFKFNKHLSFRIDFTLGYDHTLPQGIKPTFYTWSNGLKWEL
jgi:Protein of unknown function, DUF481